jgi:hypothetical protein
MLGRGVIEPVNYPIISGPEELFRHAAGGIREGIPLDGIGFPAC